MAAMPEQSLKRRSPDNRSNWKSSSVRTMRAASKWCAAGGLLSEHVSWLRRNRRPMAHYEAFAIIAEGYAKRAMICIMLKRLAGPTLNRAK